MHIQLIMRRPVFLAALFFIGSTFCWISCTKPEEELGLDLQPAEDLLQTSAVDTFLIEAYTIEEDSLRSDKLNPALIGAYVDPVFGFTKSSHITELRLSDQTVSFIPASSTIDDLVVDSLILILQYKQVLNGNVGTFFYGKPAAQYFEVFEISDSLSADSAYYDGRQIDILPSDLVKTGNNLQLVNPDANFFSGSDLEMSQIRLPLNESLAQRFLNASASQPLTNALFVSLFKGLKISVDPSRVFLQNAGIIYFETFSQPMGSKLAMYYRNTATQDTLRYDFEVRGNTAKYNQFEHDYSRATPTLRSQVVEHNKESGQQDLYVQAMGGTKVRLKFPDIENLMENSNVAINKAELIVPARLDRIDVANGLLPPPALFIFAVDENDKISLLPDQLDGVINGTYDSATKSYRFYITRFIQQILIGSRENQELEIVSTLAGSSANRVVLNGPDYPNAVNPSNNMKLAITFTKF